MNAVVFELLVQRLAAQRVIRLHQDGKVGVIGFRFARVVEAVDAFGASELITVGHINFLAAGQCPVNVFELQQAKGSVEFAHLAVDAGRDDGYLVHKTEVFQVVNAQLGFGIRADDGTAFEGVEHLGGVKTQH